MRRISPLELVGKTILDVDIYDENGVVIYPMGLKLNPNIIMQMNYKQLFIKPVAKRGRLLEDDMELIGEPEIKSIIPQSITDNLVDNTKKILYKILDQKTPDMSVCEATRDIIVDEISDKLDKAECMGQLRVFDHYTYSHTINVSSMATALGMMLNFSEEDIKDLAMGGLLHDIGKMKVSKAILNKPDKLTPDEFTEMKNHTVYGYNIITKELKLKEDIARVALEHQEKYGGFGYPGGLKGKAIHLYAQVASICDVYDALVSERVYKKAMKSHEAIKIMLSEGSRSFNPFMLYKFIYLANYKDTSALITGENSEPLTKEQLESMDTTI
ncbi:MAG: HD-GYP domain-containing protein [Candidatus Gastranaerophilales bacterium]|nr:HD-GYP domain-containing protein [Candidatus Gastranaerophilales bacterium]